MEYLYIEILIRKSSLIGESPMSTPVYLYTWNSLYMGIPIHGILRQGDLYKYVYVYVPVTPIIAGPL